MELFICLKGMRRHRWQNEEKPGPGLCLLRRTGVWGLNEGCRRLD